MENEGTIHKTTVIATGLYKHYKGPEYIVIGTGINTETGEEVVVYHGDNPLKLFVRPASMWFEDVGPDRDKEFSATELRTYVPRFQLLQEIRCGRMTIKELRGGG